MRFTTNIDLIASEYINLVRSAQPETRFTYDEVLSAETAINSYRSNNNLTSVTDIQYPLLAYRRNVLKPTDHGSSRRAKLTRIVDKESKVKYVPIIGEVELQFIFISPDVHEIENFEIQYVAETAMSSVKSFIVQLPELGPCDYTVDYAELEFKEFASDEGHYHKLVQGLATIRGLYFTAIGEEKLIEQIHAEMYVQDYTTPVPDLEINIP